ncbi:MAG TPA: BON domain-containing protein [Polyangiaceae bacterium]|jgi:osmotically-inducible protein OsmY
MDTDRVNAGNLIAAPARRRGDDFVPGAVEPEAAGSRMTTRDADLLLVSPGRARDFRITELLREALTHDEKVRIAARGVNIHTVDGEVALSGFVRSLAERAAIIATARGIAGDDHVGSWIEIRR